MCCKTCETAPSTAAEAEEQRVAERLPDDAADAADVNECIRKYDEFGRSRIDLQKVLQVVLDHLLQATGFQIRELNVLLVLDVRDPVYKLSSKY